MMDREKQKTILLVEDEAIIAMSEKMTLEKYGYKIIIANTGEEAVALVEKSPDIDLILMDINLGAGIDGTEAAVIILRDHDIPIVFLSSHTEAEIVARTEKIAAYGFIVKNSNDTVFQALIKMVFKLSDSKKKEWKGDSRQEAALEALRESEEKYRTLVERANEAIIIVQDGAFVFANQRMSDFLGVLPVDLEGKPFADFIWPEDRELVVANYKKRVAGKTVSDAYDFRIIGTGGRLTWVFLSAATIQWKGRTATLNLLTDITESKRAEMELRESKVLIDAVVENVPLMIFLKEAADLKFVIFNRAGEELLGYDRKALLGKNDLDLFPPKQAAHFMAKDQEVLNGEVGMLDIPEESILTAKKGTRLLHTRKVCIRGADGTTKYLLGISEDITERKRTEDEIKRQLSEKEILLKEVHHRIKNNIASIGGLLSLHMQSVSNPEAIAVLKDAIGRVDSMRVLYEKLLVTESYEDISVKKYIESLTDGIIALFPGSVKVTVEKRITDFQLEPKRLFPLGLIINELLTNKMKYAFVGRKSGTIEISLTNANNHVTLVMQDDGVGLPNGFDIKESKGFGLMLVKMLSQQLGGNFSIETHKGTRSTVEFNM